MSILLNCLFDIEYGQLICGLLRLLVPVKFLNAFHLPSLGKASHALIVAYLVRLHRSSLLPCEVTEHHSVHVAIVLLQQGEPF